MTESEKYKLKEEIKKEFQLERMVLFSDAVFAIVITLMAIEIHLPEAEHGYSLTQEELIHSLKHLVPTISAYIASFVFIGVIWNQHLKLFSLMKSYDQGLVFRNLVLLFFMGLFPFAAAIISHTKGNVLALLIYFSIITCSLASLALIEHYIFFKKPQLRNDEDITIFLEKHRQRKVSIIAFIIVIILAMVTDKIIDDPTLSFIPMMWVMLIPITFKIMGKGKKKK